MTYRNAWDDPMVQEALKERDSAHVCLIQCERCGNYGYYNEGSHFTCSVKGCDWFADGEEIDLIIASGNVITLDDYVDMQVNTEDLP